MQRLNLTWKTDNGQYSSGEILYLNRLPIARYWWNAARNKNDANTNNQYKGRVDLPGLKTPEKMAGTEEDIKQKLETAVSVWFIEALKK